MSKMECPVCGKGSKMNIPVHMLAFETERGTIREVEIPEEEAVKITSTEDMLKLVFKYGQNDFQNKYIRSISVGDVVQLGIVYFMVMGVGFSKISAKEFEELVPPTYGRGSRFKTSTE